MAGNVSTTTSRYNSLVKFESQYFTNMGSRTQLLGDDLSQLKSY